MSVKEKIAKVKDKAAKLAVKAATVATLLGGAGTAVSCSGNNRDTDENGNKIEKAEGQKTSVVVDANYGYGRDRSYSKILLKDGTYIHGVERDKRFIEEGDTITYITQEKFGETDNVIQSVKYKDGNPNLNFDKNQEAYKNGNRVDNIEGKKTSVVFRANHGVGRSGSYDEILFENGLYIAGNKGNMRFLMKGDTVTYETRRTMDERYPDHTITEIKYKNGNPKVNFDKNRDIGKDWNKIEETDGEKTSVVFRVNHGVGSIGALNEILFEDGSYIVDHSKDTNFVREGDTITYETLPETWDKPLTIVIKKVKYKDGNPKVNIDENRNPGKNWNKIEETDGEKTSVVFRVNHGVGSIGALNEILFEDGSYIDDNSEGLDFIRDGDTITYEIPHTRWGKARKIIIKAVKHKVISEKQVNFDKNRDTDENGNEIEKENDEKSSAVFRIKQSKTKNAILLENGDVLTQSIGDGNIIDEAFLEPGDTVTYKGNEVKAVRYKDGNGKQVNFGKIGKVGKDITD